MDFVVLPQSNWSAFSRLNEVIAEIDEKCLSIVEMLKEAFERGSLVGANVCSIEIARSSHEFALLRTPVGNGRVIRGWSRSAQELEAKLLFQREQFDPYDQRYWETVWGITVPRYEVAYSGIGANALRFDLDGFSGNRRNIVFAAAMSILSGLVDGPRRATAE
jgi:hypothetical protein